MKYFVLVLLFSTNFACKADSKPKAEVNTVPTEDITISQADDNRSEDKLTVQEQDPPSPEEMKNDQKKDRKPVVTSSDIVLTQPKITSAQPGTKNDTQEDNRRKEDEKAVVQQIEKQSKSTEKDIVVEESNQKTISEIEITQPTVTAKVVENEKPVEQKENIHSSFNALLSTYVSSSGKVNYAGIKKNKAQLEAYLNTLKTNPPTSSWSKNKKLAYWINVYNAFTIKKIIDNYPLNSITDLYGGKPWDVKWIDIDGKTYSLNDVENAIIRPRFNDARIHFAVNCAAQSCPPLFNKAYTESNVNTLLANNAKSFINNEKYNTITPGSITVSKIFDWYKEDFGSLIAYLNKYSKVKINPDATVNFKEYDWSLNN